MHRLPCGLLALAACIAPSPPPPAIPAPAAPAATSPDEGTPLPRVAPGVLRGLLRAGELAIAPDAATAAAMVRDQRPDIGVDLTVCLDVRGQPTAVVRRPSPYAAFDRAALAAVAGWRFQPLVRDGLAIAACSDARFTHAAGAPAAPPAPALPAAEVELPAARVEAVAVPPGRTGRPPTPGVAMTWVCRKPGLVEAPLTQLFQSSGDAATDRALLDERETMPADEARGPGLLCALRTRLVPPAPSPPAPDRMPDATPATIAPAVLEEKRISGEAAIAPSDVVKTEVQRRGLRQIAPVLRLCLDRAGRPTAVRLARSSGFVAYDIDLVNGVATWRYRPLLIDGRPEPVCSTITFVYRLRG